eukprot:jgi/Galph1/2945/GphlegSOOS_G1637.1
MPCCYDGLSAKLIEQNGFKLSFMSGFGVAAVHGVPDTGLLSYGEIVSQLAFITQAVNIPIIADGDTGYGNILNVKRTVKGFAKAGAAGIMLEDQVNPKRCGHTRGKSVVSREEAELRIQAAVDAREELGQDIVIVARTDAVYTHSLEEAIARMKAFRKRGADILFMEAPQSIEQMKAFCSQVKGPKMANMVEQGTTPLLPPKELAAVGYKLVAYPLTLLSASIKAMENAIQALQSGNPEQLKPLLQDFSHQMCWIRELLERGEKTLRDGRWLLKQSPWAVVISFVVLSMTSSPSCKDKGLKQAKHTSVIKNDLLIIPHIEEHDTSELAHWQHMIAGATAGLTETAIMFPFDTVKTRLQSETIGSESKNLFSCLSEIVRKEGLLKLWRGLAAASFTAGPGHAIYFATYEIGKRAFSTNQEGYQPLATAGAGALAALVADGVFIPFDVIKQRMQLQSKTSNILAIATRVYRERGIGAFFAGYTTTLIMEVPYTAIHFATYEGVKHFLLNWREIGHNEFSLSSNMIAGALAGIVASGLTNPLDVVKTRLQTQGEKTSSSYRNMFHAMRVIMKEEGFRGFLRGAEARMLFHAPSASICFGAYASCKYLFSQFSSATAEEKSAPSI